MAQVIARDVVKKYGDVEVLQGVSVDIADGEMLVILGASGCGKTTFLRLIAGLERLTGGEIRIGERVVNDVEPKDRDIAMVFQNYALYPHMSVYENMAYGLRNRRTPRREIERRVQEAAGILGLQDLLKRRPRQLSGGQRQRVAMGRAMVREPAVFLFDEPLSNLDASLRTQMRVEIRDLQQRLGTTGIFVTHDQVEAMTLADRIMLLNAGRIEQIGTPMELYRHPATTFVATFIGAPRMNLLPAAVFGEGGKVQLAGGHLQAVRPGLLPGGQLTAGIRPEDVVPVSEGGLPMTVRFVERLGADQIVFAQLDGHGQFLIRLPGSASVHEDEMLRVSAAPDVVHLFDGTSGQRIEPQNSQIAA